MTLIIIITSFLSLLSFSHYCYVMNKCLSCSSNVELTTEPECEDTVTVDLTAEPPLSMNVASATVTHTALHKVDLFFSSQLCHLSLISLSK